MTHTLHRLGDTENLKNDFIVYALTSGGKHSRGARDKKCKFLEICAKYRPVNIGSIRGGYWTYAKGNNLEEIIAGTDDRSDVAAVYDSKEKAAKALSEVKQTDLGLSIVFTGLFEETFDVLRKIGLQPHTVNMSLGIWGKTELLPEREILEITTMCGHGLISTNLVRKLIQEVKRGRLSPYQAGLKLGSNCQCGAFNPQRGADLISKIAKKQS